MSSGPEDFWIMSFKSKFRIPCLERTMSLILGEVATNTGKCSRSTDSLGNTIRLETSDDSSIPSLFVNLRILSQASWIFPRDVPWTNFGEMVFFCRTPFLIRNCSLCLWRIILPVHFSYMSSKVLCRSLYSLVFKRCQHCSGVCWIKRFFIVYKCHVKRIITRCRIFYYLIGDMDVIHCTVSFSKPSQFPGLLRIYDATYAVYYYLGKQLVKTSAWVCNS